MKLRRLISLILLLLPMYNSAAQMTGTAKGAVGVTSPILPRKLIASTINAANFPDLFPAAVNVTICASGCNYTTIQAFFNAINSIAPNCSVIATVTAGYVAETLGNGQTDYYQKVCPANKHVWLRSSAWNTTLPPQGTKVSQANQAAMFEVIKYSTAGGYDSAFNFCGAAGPSGCTVGTGSQGLLTTGMWVHNQGAVSIFAVFFFGYNSDTANFASRFWLDRVLVDVDSYNTQVAIGIYNNADWISITDSDISGISVLHGQGQIIPTGGGSIQVTTLDSGGSGYAVNDTFSVDGGECASGTVTGVSGGAVTTYTITNGGNGYSVTSGEGTQRTSGSGSGLTINITNVDKGAVIGSGGSGYTVGDTGNIVQVGGLLATYQVASVSSGVVTSFTIPSQGGGRGYTIANGVSTTRTSGSGSGFTVNITGTECIECYASPAGESHGFLSYNSHGPIKIVNSNIGGDPFATVPGSTTENFILGGAPPAAGTIQPSDIEVRECLFSKDPNQLNSGPSGSCTKNNFEVKGAGQRILADGNTLQYSWNDPYESQTGVAIDFYVTQNGSTCPECQVSDITFTNNVVQFAAGTFSVEGHNAVPPYIQNPVVTRILLDNNLWSGMSQALWGSPVSTTVSGINVLSGGVIGPPSNVNLPGPYNVTFANNAVYGPPANNMQVLYAQYPPGCDAQQQTVAPNWALDSNVWIVDTPTLAGSGPGNGKLDSQCGYPNLQIVQTVFPNLQTDAKNILFNFKYTGTCSVGAACTCANWPSSPGVCPIGVAASPSQISAFLTMTNVTNCLAGTGSITNCNITGTYASRGPSIAQILAHQTLGNDAVIPGAGPRTAP